MGNRMSISWKDLLCIILPVVGIASSSLAIVYFCSIKNELDKNKRSIRRHGKDLEKKKKELELERESIRVDQEEKESLQKWQFNLRKKEVDLEERDKSIELKRSSLRLQGKEVEMRMSKIVDMKQQETKDLLDVDDLEKRERQVEAREKAVEVREKELEGSLVVEAVDCGLVCTYRVSGV